MTNVGNLTKNQHFFALPFIALALLSGLWISANPQAGYTTVICGLMALIGFINYRLLAGVSLALIILLPEGDLLIGLGFYLPVGSSKLNLMDLLLLVNLAFSGVNLLAGTLRLKSSRVGVGLMLFLGFSAVAFVRGVGSFGAKMAWMDYRALLFFTTFYLAAGMLQSRKDLVTATRILIFGLIGHGILVAFLAVFSETLISPELYRHLFDYDNTAGRFAFSNTNPASILIPLLLVFRGFGRRLIQPLPLWVAVGLLLLPIVIGMSRSTMAQLLCNFFVCLLVSVRHDRRSFKNATGTLVASGLALGLISLISPFVPILSTILSRFSLVAIAESGMGRLLSSAYAYQSFLAHPLLGTGFGSQLGLVWLTGEVTDKLFVDDAWATVLAKSGLLGGAMFAAFLLSCWLDWRRCYDQASAVARDLLLAILGSMPFVLVSLTLLSAHLVHSRVTITVFCLGLALLIRYPDISNDHAKPALSSPA